MAVNNLNTPGVGIQPSIVDAKGDLLVGTANDAIDRLGVTGTTGAVLTADAGETTGLKWVDPGTVGGLVHIETQNPSGVSSVSFSNDVFTSTYENYVMFFNLSLSGAFATILWRGITSGTPNSTSNYNSQRLEASNTTISGSRSTGETSGRLAGTSTEPIGFQLNIYSPQVSKKTLIRTLTTAAIDNTLIIDYATVFNTTQAFDSIQILAASGNLTGKITLFGVKE